MKILFILLLIFLTGCTSTPEEKEFRKESKRLFNEMSSEYEYECKIESFQIFPRNIVTRTQKANDYTSDKKSDAMNNFLKSVAREYTTSKDINAGDRNKHYKICIEDRLSKTDYPELLEQLRSKYFTSSKIKNTASPLSNNTSDIKELEKYNNKFIAAAKMFASKDREQNLPEIVSAFEELAKSGHARSQYYLGYFYITGTGKQKNYSKGKYWHLKSARQGVTKAMTSLGIIYTHGLGSVVDYIEARKWLEKAIVDGDPKASLVMGTHFENGLGVDVDPILAIENYSLACQRGSDKGCESMKLIAQKISSSQ